MQRLVKQFVQKSYYTMKRYLLGSNIYSSSAASMYLDNFGCFGSILKYTE